MRSFARAMERTGDPHNAVFVVWGISDFDSITLRVARTEDCQPTLAWIIEGLPVSSISVVEPCRSSEGNTLGRQSSDHRGSALLVSATERTLPYQ